MDGWFDTILDGAKSGFASYMESGKWVGDVASGVGAGILSYQQDKNQKELAERQNNWKNERYYAQSADVNGYESHLPLASGKVTHQGLLAGGAK